MSPDGKDVVMATKFRWFALLLLGQAASLPAQIAVSANDGKQKGADAKSEATTPDSIAILNIGGPAIRTLATLDAPASLIGPPATVALSRDSRFAIVTAGQQTDASGSVVPADIVTVIDLSQPSKPRIVQTLHAEAGASGVAINPAGTLALVANAGDDSISIFSIADRRLSPAGTIALAPKSKPLDIAFSADGHSAYVVAQGAGALMRLAVDGRTVTTAETIPLGVQPYSMALDAAKAVAYVTNLSGRTAANATPGPKSGTIAIVDLKARRMTDQVDVGVTPEHVALSPSGRYLEVTVINGSNAPAASPHHHEHGVMMVFRADGFRLSPVSQVDTGAWCQGATWSDNEKRIVIQCAARKQIEVYRFDGKSLTRDPAQTLQFVARPGAIATARSR
jgi:DNA-binding beta-propeller fold protein YncE